MRHFIRIRIFLLFLLVTATGANAYAQKCGNFETDLSITHSPCQSNGAILVEVTGPDVTPGDNGEPAPLNNLQYCAVPAGTTPKETDWRNTNNLKGLPPGTYDVYVRGTCLYDDNKLTVHTVSKTAKVNQLDGWAPVDVNYSIRSGSLRCIPTGVISLTNLRGGLAPFNIEITEAPASYTGPTKVLEDAEKLPSTFQIENLPAGTYKVVLSEGSACHSSIEISNLVVGDIGGNFPPSMFYSYFYPAQSFVPASSRGDDTEYWNSLGVSFWSPGTTHPYYYVWTNRDKYYEYAMYYKGDDISDPDALTWTAMPLSGFVVDSLPYNVSEMQGDKENKRPRFLVRLKGCDEVVESANPQVRNAYPRISTSYSDCGDATMYFYMYSDYDGFITYPYTWKVMKVESGVETLYAESSKPVKWGGGNHYFYDIPKGSYKIYVYDAHNRAYTNTFSVSPSSPAASMSNTIGSARCEGLYLPALYLGTSTYGGLANIKSIEYVKTQKYVGNQWVDDPSFPAPPLLKLDMDDIPADSLKKYNTYVTLWAKTVEDAVIPSPPSISSTSYSYFRLLESKVGWINPGDEYYSHHVLVEDRCNPGVKVAKTISGHLYRYEHVGTPDFQWERSCSDNSVEITIPNISTLIRQFNRSSKAYQNRTAYARVVSSPSGASVSYSNGSYLNSASTSVRINKPGKYVFAVTPFSTYPNINNQDDAMYYNCAQFYELIIPEILQFEMDTDNSAAYRCPGTGVGGGLGRIEVKVKSGMGPFKFELFAGDDTNRETPLQSNTDGIFQNWNTSNSDEYWVVGYDYGCPGKVVSFDQLISVYDLSNGVRISTEGNRLCIGDSIVLRSLALGETDYEWEFIKPTGSSSTFVWTGDKRDEIIEDATLEMNGSYKVTVSIPGCSGSPKVSGSVDISVGEKLLYWNPKGEDANWFNANNWLRHDGQVSEYTPAGCTTVHIPGLADYYPNLHNDYSPWGSYGYPSCDSIIYHYGGETAYPSFLQYNRAFVQYNFGKYDTFFDFFDPDNDAVNDTPVSRDTYGSHTYPGLAMTDQVPSIRRSYWAMVATPLKGVVGGDFGVGGRPFIYQRAFNMTSPENGQPSVNVFTDAFSKMNIPTSDTYNSIALWAADYNNWGGIPGAKDHSYLEGLEGVLELPYFGNSADKDLRPLHRYSADSSTSRFYYFRLSDLEEDPYVAPDVYVRPSDSYRFVIEGSDNEPEKIQIGNEWVSVYQLPLKAVGSGFGNSIMIGNPLMCHLDFDKFYSLNSSIIEPEYSFIDYTNGNELVYQVGNPLSDLTKDIAPLQGFIVKRKNPQSTEKLMFHLDGLNSVVSYGSSNMPLGKPRTASLGDSCGYITVSTRSEWGGESFVSNSSVLYDKLSSSVSGYTPDYLDRRAYIFFLGDDNVSTYRYKRYSSTPSVMRLSTITHNTEDIELTVTVHADDLVEKLILRDNSLGVEQDVTNGGSYIYKHRVNQSQLGVQGLDNTRFELLASYKTNSIDDLSSSSGSLSVLCRDNRLDISGSVLISEVRMSSVSGVLLFSDQGVDSEVYSRDLVLPSGAYLVQVVLKDGSIESRKVLVE